MDGSTSTRLASTAWWRSLRGSSRASLYDWATGAAYRYLVVWVTCSRQVMRSSSCGRSTFHSMKLARWK